MVLLRSGGVRGERRRGVRLGERGERRVGEMARMVEGKRKRRGGRRCILGEVRGGAGGGKEGGWNMGRWTSACFICA